MNLLVTFIFRHHLSRLHKSRFAQFSFLPCKSPCAVIKVQNFHSLKHRYTGVSIEEPKVFIGTPCCLPYIKGFGSTILKSEKLNRNVFGSVESWRLILDHSNKNVRQDLGIHSHTPATCTKAVTLAE